MHHFILYKWKPEFNGQPQRYRVLYRPEYYNVIVRRLKEELTIPHRVVVVTDDPEGLECETFPLWSDYNNVPNPSGRNLPSCYRRLKIFHPPTTEQMGIPYNEWVVSMDADTVVVGNGLDELFKNDHPFMAFRGRTTLHPTLYNGSMYRFRAGTLSWVWDKFDPVRTPPIVRRAGFFGSDQGYLSYCFATRKGEQGRAPGWDRECGVLSYSSDLGRTRAALIPRARLVFFNGKLKPWHSAVRTQSPWVEEYCPLPYPVLV